MGYWTSTLTGAVFGAALTASDVYQPSVIIDQLRLKDFHMLEVFLTAGASSALIMLALETFGIVKRSVRTNSTLNWFSPHDGNVIGGSMIGLGMGLTGACPGTVLVQCAQNVPSGPPTLLGAVMGGTAYAIFGPSLKLERPSTVSHTQPYPTEARTLGSTLSITPRTMFMIFELLVLSVLTFSNIVLPGRSLATLPTIQGGLLIGGAQAISILLTHQALGISGAYEQAGRYVGRFLGFSQVSKPSSVPLVLMFALGVYLGSLGYTSVVIPAATRENASAINVTMAQALLGGFVMAFGSRVAGGCTSGHGLSGLPALSLSSLITVVAMFGGGILFGLLT